MFQWWFNKYKELYPTTKHHDKNKFCQLLIGSLLPKPPQDVWQEGEMRMGQGNREKWVAENDEEVGPWPGDKERQTPADNRLSLIMW